MIGVLGSPYGSAKHAAPSGDPQISQYLIYSSVFADLAQGNSVVSGDDTICTMHISDPIALNVCSY